MQPGCPLVGAKVGPCGSPRRKPRRDTRPSPSISRRSTIRGVQALPRRPIRVHPALSPWRFAIWRVVARGRVTTYLLQLDLFLQTYFYAPRPDMTCYLFGLWPLERSPNGTCKQLAGDSESSVVHGLTAAPFPVNLVQRQISLRPDGETKSDPNRRLSGG
jgi:hypothetical protein